jgi:hypothetical protein
MSLPDNRIKNKDLKDNTYYILSSKDIMVVCLYIKKESSYIHRVQMRGFEYRINLRMIKVYELSELVRALL